MARPRTHSTNHYGLWHILKLPIISISFKPKYLENSKTKIFDEKGNVIFDGEKQHTQSGIFVHEEREVEAIRFLHGKGIQVAEIKKITTELPLLCPICDKEGTPVPRLDKRLQKIWIDPDTPIGIYYYHGSKPHYIGRWKNGTLHHTQKITDIRKLTARGYLSKNKTK